MITALALLLPGVIIASEAQAASETSVSGRVTVSGTDILIDGEIPEEKFFGVVDTTALQFAIMAYVNGDTSVAGKNSVFDGPDTSSNGGKISQNATANDFWHQYFALMKHYDCNLVRIGAGDSWGSSIQYQAWLNHRESYVSMLKTMCEEAMEHGVWVCLVLAGSQEYPAYQFGGEGSVFDTSSSAYSNYIQYCKSMMSLLENENAVAMYDMFNEPDHNNCNANYWHGDKQAFSNWASAVAEDTNNVSTHPRTLGVAGYGDLFSSWSQEDFDLSTGDVGFEIAHRHYYASAKDSSLFEEPEKWAENSDIPLFWGELADNSVYPLTRYSFAEEEIWDSGGQAITSMVLTGTDGYPYTGGTLPDPDEPAYGNNNNNEENDTINNPEGNNSNGSLNTDQGSIDSSEKNESKGSSASLAVISLISAIVIAIALFTARKQ